jgi:hypothetical protein
MRTKGGLWLRFGRVHSAFVLVESRPERGPLSRRDRTGCSGCIRFATAAQRMLNVRVTVRVFGKADRSSYMTEAAGRLTPAAFMLPTSSR